MLIGLITPRSRRNDNEPRLLPWTSDPMGLLPERRCCSPVPERRILPRWLQSLRKQILTILTYLVQIQFRFDGPRRYRPASAPLPRRPPSAYNQIVTV